MCVKLAFFIVLFSIATSIAVASQQISPTSDDNKIQGLLNNLTNSSNPITNEFDELLALFQETYNLDKCTDDLRTLIEGTTAYRIFSKRDYHDKIYNELIGVLIEIFFFDVKVQSFFAVNQDCVGVYNLCLKFLKTFWVPSRESLTPRNQIVNTTFENGSLQSIVSSIEDLNAFWACTVDNIKFAYLLQSLYRNGYFRPGDLDAVNSIGLRFAYNLEHCKMLADLIVGDKKEFFALIYPNKEA